MPLRLIHIGITGFDIEGITIQTSSPSVLFGNADFSPKCYTYDECAYIMENLRNLRHELMQQLLECCTSIKTKRLFLHLASLLHHAWLNQLDMSKIELGKGARMIQKGGN